MPRRQDVPECFDMNASVYVYKRNALLDHDTLWLDDTVLYKMPPERSVDIDTEMDFKFVEFLLGQN